MNYCVCKLVDYLVMNEIVSYDMRQKYIYGFELLFGKVINYVTLFLLSVINHNIIQTLLFMVTFFTLRGRTGGYHAKTNFCCYLGTICIYFGVSKGIVPLLVINRPLFLGTVGFSIFTIFLFAPINHPNLGLDEKEINICKKFSRLLIILSLFSVIILIWLKINPKYISYVVAGMGMDAGLVILAKIIKQEVQDYEKC